MWCTKHEVASSTCRVAAKCKPAAAVVGCWWPLWRLRQAKNACSAARAAGTRETRTIVITHLQISVLQETEWGPATIRRCCGKARASIHPASARLHAPAAQALIAQCAALGEHSRGSMVPSVTASGYQHAKLQWQCPTHLLAAAAAVVGLAAAAVQASILQMHTKGRQQGQPNAGGGRTGQPKSCGHRHAHLH